MKKVYHLGANLDRIISVIVYRPVGMISGELPQILPHTYTVHGYTLTHNHLCS